MSDKDRDKIAEIDRQIRKAVGGVGPTNDGTHVTIEYHSGFELFNTRPYHNYETWSAGYRVTGYGITVDREDLDDAVREWAEKRTAQREQSGVKPWAEDPQAKEPTR